MSRCAMKTRVSMHVLLACLTAMLTAGAAAQRGSYPDEPAQDDNQPATDEQDETKDVKPVYVRMTTSKGEIILELNKEKSPKTVENFMRYVEQEFYDGTIFHRVIAQFMIQGGGFTAEMSKKPTREGVENEWRNGLTNDRGTIAMARIGGRPDSGTSQFFINVVDNTGLDRPQPDGAAYTVFGKVVAGMETVDAIRSVPVQRCAPPLNPNEVSCPVETIMIEKVRAITKEQAQQAIDAEKKPAEEKSPPATTPGSESGSDAGG